VETLVRAVESGLRISRDTKAPVEIAPRTEKRTP
jgi:hypothetical protein